MEALWVFLPVLGAYLAHAPVLTHNLWPGFARPIDAGATWRGRRLLGANKTWRGLVVMFAGVVAVALLLSFLPAYWERVPDDIQKAGRGWFALLLGLGFAVAELPNSFLKRQLDINPGTRVLSPLGIGFVVLDQCDFVFGIWLALTPIWVMSLTQAAWALGAATAVHMVINVIGYAIGARTTWI